MRGEPVVDDDLDDPYEDLPAPPISFSLDEGIHLAFSIFVLAVAFSFALSGSALWDWAAGGIVDDPGRVFTERVLPVLPYAIGIVVTAFVLHELAHKVAAQRRNMWAEYRSSWGGLGIGLVISSLTGFVLAAPGAVFIIGRATDRDSGVISVVGPLVNLAIGFAAVPFAFYWGEKISVGGLGNLFEVVVFVNAFLALFNMLPIPPLDGSKVLRWSKLAYVGTMALIALLFVIFFNPAILTG